MSCVTASFSRCTRVTEEDQLNREPACCRLTRCLQCYYLGGLVLAFYPVLVFATPLPGCGAVPPVPGVLPPFVLFTPERRTDGHEVSCPSQQVDEGVKVE